MSEVNKVSKENAGNVTPVEFSKKLLAEVEAKFDDYLNDRRVIDVIFEEFDEQAQDDWVELAEKAQSYAKKYIADIKEQQAFLDSVKDKFVKILNQDEYAGEEIMLSGRSTSVYNQNVEIDPMFLDTDESDFKYPAK